VYEADPFPAQLEAEVEGQRSHEVLGAPVGVLQGPVHRKLAEVAVVLGDMAQPQSSSSGPIA
jgi:hypothetical protein